jgi:predicted ATPase
MGDGVATQARETGGEGGGPAGRAPMLRSISVAGFKSIRKIENLELRPINVLIGPNGSGKSNFIQTFALAQAIEAARLNEYVLKAGGADRLLHFGRRTTDTITLQLEFGKASTRYHLSATDDDRLLAFWTYPMAPEFADLREALKKRLRFLRVYHFHDTGDHSPLKKTADLDDNRLLRADGSNLSAFLYLLQERYPDSYDLIRRTLQLIAPFFEDFQLAPRALNPDTIRLEWRHKASDQYFDVSSLSDGTLRFIALATLFLQPEKLRPSVIIVDEPDLGLHPAAIDVLASLVRRVSHRTQVIMATQSVGLLDRFEPEDVIVADRTGNEVSFRRLDGSDLAEWLESYTLSELWEKNVLGGGPTR